MEQYLRTRLEDGRGIVYIGGFPVKCPECGALEWEVDGDTAAKVLEKTLLEEFHVQSLMASLSLVRRPEARVIRGPWGMVLLIPCGPFECRCTVPIQNVGSHWKTWKSKG